MVEGRLHRAGFDERIYVMVRVAALAAVGGPPTSWMDLLSDADRVGLDASDIEGVVVAISPLIGTPRATEARGAVLTGLGLAAMAGVVDEEDNYDTQPPVVEG